VTGLTSLMAELRMLTRPINPARGPTAQSAARQCRSPPESASASRTIFS